MRTSRSWRLIIVGAALIALTLAACRGGGASPPSNTELKVIRPTTPASVCRNDSYPADAPQFEGSEELAWQTTPSGVKYYDYATGAGEQATLDSIVEVHYSGWLSDGCLFDSTRLRDDTALLRLEFVIPGWQEGMNSMNVGGRRRLEIPSQLAYGELGRLPAIPPNSDLVFDVELFDVITPPEATATTEALIIEATATTEAMIAEATASAAAGQ